MALKQQLAVRYIRTKFSILSRLSKTKAARVAFELFCTPQYRNKKSLPASFVRAEQLSFPFQGNRIAGYGWHRERKEKVLILHGFESSVVNFSHYIKPLLEKGYGVLAFDAPAHGRSSGNTIDVLLYRAFIKHIIATYGPVTHFIGHSLGGLALSLTLEEIPGNEKFRVVLIAPATETHTAIDYFFKYLRLPDTMRAAFDQIIMEKSGVPPEWFSIARAAGNIRSQVLWVHDEEDDLTPVSDVTPVIKAAHPNFTFHITRGLGHRRIYRDKEVVKKIVDFL